MASLDRPWIRSRHFERWFLAKRKDLYLTTQKPKNEYSPEAFLKHFDEQEEKLQAQGFPPISPWWRKSIEDFFKSNTKTWVVRVGRRGGKSSTLCRLAVAIATAQYYVVPPGDVGVIPIVSINRDEASDKLRTLDAILRALSIQFERTSDTIRLKDYPVEFRVYACSSKSVVGFTAISIIMDEVAVWENAEKSADPAREVYAALKPTASSQPVSWIFLISSPWGTQDLHAELFGDGSNEHQWVSYAPTWVANPTISEAHSHTMEPDERLWERAYKAIPGSVSSLAFNIEDISKAFTKEPRAQGNRFCCIDASSLKSDSFSYMFGGESHNQIIIESVESLTYTQTKDMEMAQVVSLVAQECRQREITTVYADQREEASLKSLFAQEGVYLSVIPWTEASKEQAFSLIRRWLRERSLAIPSMAQRLRREMEAVPALLTVHGSTRYPTNGRDQLSCLVTLAHAVIARKYFPPMDGPSLQLKPKAKSEKEIQREVMNPAKKKVVGY